WRKVRHEEVSEGLDRLPFDPVYVALELEAGRHAPEQRTDVVLAAPEYRRGRIVRRRGHVGRRAPDEIDSRAHRRPDRLDDGAVAPADTGHLVGRPLKARGEHMSEGRAGAVEASIRKRQAPGVSLPPLDLEASALALDSPARSRR